MPRREPRTYLYVAAVRPGENDLLLTSDLTSPTAIELPKARLLRDNAEPGEGVWTTTGLPRSSPDNVLIFIRPDRSRPYALVGVVLMDHRRVRLHLVGGTVDPGGDRGVKGPGVIPQDQHGKLLVAWNGGFQGPHGGFGMLADGKEYRPLRNGLASIAVMKDVSVKMGEWGRDLVRDENTLPSVRTPSFSSRMAK